MMSAKEVKVHNPPASLVPRLHAVHINKLDTVNPLVVCEPDITQKKASILKEAKEIRENIISILEHSLCGDSLSAEYLLCHLLSSVYIRKETVAVGKLPLNITKVPPNNEFIKLFVELIQTIVTSMQYLPLSLRNMNTLTFAPCKDYEANRLKSGILQLPKRCHLVLDETAMEPGQLDVNGVKNLTSLGNLIRWQKVSYDFQFHQQDFEADVPVLTLSEGKSLLPCDILLPLDINQDISIVARYNAIKTYMTPDLIDKIRLYLTLIPTIDYQMNEHMTKIVQEDFVSTRQAAKESMSIDDFQLLLVLSRLVSVSYGLTELTSDVWSKVKQLEAQRKTRLNINE